MNSLTITFVGGFGLAILLILLYLAYRAGKYRGKLIGFDFAYDKIMNRLNDSRKDRTFLWNSVDDCLPSFDEIVVVYDCNHPEVGVGISKRIDVDSFRVDEHKFMVFNNDMNITHWLVIPAMPQPDKDK